MRMALYGLPCAGKTTLLTSLKNYIVINGSLELNKISNGTFKTLKEDEKEKIRVKYIEYLMSLTDDVVLSDGHYSFFDNSNPNALYNVVFTEHDAKAYDVFVYLYCSPETILRRVESSEKNQKYQQMSISMIARWQTFEIEAIRKACHKNNKDFYVIDGEKITAEGFTDFIEKIRNGYSSYSIANRIARTIMNTYPTPCTLCLVDGDKTLIVQDSFRVCSHGYKTSAFDGDFYTGYQSLIFTEEAQKVKYNLDLINTIEINHQVYDLIKDSPYYVLSAGIEHLWNEIARKYNLKNVIANPLISADAKYFVVKILQESGYFIKAYGDSKNDLYMLREAHDGYLCVTEKLSRSLSNADISNLKLIYDRSAVILNDICPDVIKEDIAICKSNSGINGKELAKAHFALGERVGVEISKQIPSNDATVIVLERGGRFFGDGVYMSFGGKFCPYNPSKDPIPTITSSTVIIVDSVINTGKSILKIIDAIRKSNSNVEIIVVSNVIQEKALALLNNYKIYAIRISANSFKGVNQATQIGNTGPDTADRLFNLILG